MKSLILLFTAGLFLLHANSTYSRTYNNNIINIPSSENDKIFIKEYTYNASDNDSKNSSRKIAIAELKSLLSEEIGVHIQSSFDIKKTLSSKIVRKEINQLSASITKVKILEEKWNGVTYYIKASVKVNEEQTMKLLLEAIKAKASKKDLERLTKILKKKNYKINELNTQITLNEFFDKKYDEYKNQLDFNYQLRFYIDYKNILHTDNGSIYNFIRQSNNTTVGYGNQTETVLIVADTKTIQMITIPNKKFKGVAILAVYNCFKTDNWTLGK